MNIRMKLQLQYWQPQFEEKQYQQQFYQELLNYIFLVQNPNNIKMQSFPQLHNLFDPVLHKQLSTTFILNSKYICRETKLKILIYSIPHELSTYQQH
ncbi:unnamed protein product [Paramecium sonneborni]|uniref:Uncharacterized protein n=1 Tax=Paramecium sonneborni TaxID=65129 RepID=A0A8S1PQ51_9CILI|nr:unnamed protein product [Paramecium sonneborni]